MRRSAFIVLALLLAGCGSPSYQHATAISGVSPPRHATFATQLAGPNTYLPPMPTAVVILKPDNMARNRAFCRAVMQLPTAEEEMSRSPVASNLILTRWLTQISEIPPDRAFDCEFLVGIYDFRRAERLMDSLRDATGPAIGDGPFLAMIVPDSRGLRVAAIDGSYYSSNDFSRFIASWQDAVYRTQSQLSRQPDRPGIVRSVFDLVSAVLRTVFGGTAGLIEGTVGGL